MDDRIKFLAKELLNNFVIIENPETPYAEDETHLDSENSIHVDLVASVIKQVLEIYDTDK